MLSFLKKKKIIAAVVVVIVVVVGLLIRSKSNSLKYEDTELTSTIVKQSVTASGEVKSLNEIDLSFTTVGKLVALNVSKGDFIKKGTLIAYLNPSASYQTTKAAEEARNVAKHDLDIYIENYETNLQAVGGADEYALGVKRLKNLLDKAESTYQAQLSTHANLFMYAPFTGTVIDTYFKENETVSAVSPVVKLADLDNLIFEAKVDQEDFGLLKVGQPVIITLDSYDNVKFTGKVIELPLYAQDASDFIVKVAIENSTEHPVLLGMLGDMEITVAQTESEVDALFFDSIFTDDEGTFVWVLDKKAKSFEKKYIEIGLEGDLYTEVKTDLSGLQLVIPEEK